jgi:hypothetical protein
LKGRTVATEKELALTVLAMQNSKAGGRTVRKPCACGGKCKSKATVESPRTAVVRTTPASVVQQIVGTPAPTAPAAPARVVEYVAPVEPDALQKAISQHRGISVVENQK